MRRAVGDRPCAPSPITNRWSPACATSASRCPSGLQCTLATPYFSLVSCHGSPPSSGRIQAWRDRVVVADRRADEGDSTSVGRDGRRSVANAAAGQLARPTAAKRSGPEVRLVVVAGARGAGRRRSPRRRGRGGTTRARPGRGPARGVSHRSCGGVCAAAACDRRNPQRMRGNVDRESVACAILRPIDAAVPPRAAPRRGRSGGTDRCDAHRHLSSSLSLGLLWRRAAPTSRRHRRAGRGEARRPGSAGGDETAAGPAARSGSASAASPTASIPGIGVAVRGVHDVRARVRHADRGHRRRASTCRSWRRSGRVVRRRPDLDGDPRDDATFHDGEPLTAEDVSSRSSCTATTDFPFLPSYADVFETITRRRRHDADASTTERAGRQLRVPTWSSSTSCPSTSGRARTRSSFENEEMIGSGPFRLAEASQGEFVELARQRRLLGRRRTSTA